MPAAKKETATVEKKTTQKKPAEKKVTDERKKRADARNAKVEEDVRVEDDQESESPAQIEPILDKEPVKKKASSNEKWGIVHIYSSYNNTHIHITDVTGSETIAKVTGGMITKSDRLKATPNVAMAAAKQISEACHNAGITSLYVKLRAVGGHNGPMTPGPGAQAAIRMLTRYGMKLGRIEDVTPVPHDHCRKKGGKRGRRV